MPASTDGYDDTFPGRNGDDPPSGDPSPGARIGAYEVVRMVARGGMATVLEVIDTRDTPVSEGPLAIKLLLPLASAEEARSRFRREFRALSRLTHPNVLRVHEWGLLEDRPWYSMELVTGRDLRDEVVELAKLQPADRFARVEQILKQVARALAYIHERGMVHRDVTPGNIMVQPNGHTTLMDFGVVKDLGADLTAVGEVIGTVAWMAPEQITSNEIDARADLYSLGAVLYLLLTGKRPFTAHTLHGFMEKHLNEKPVPPIRHDPFAPTRLNDICLRLLEKKPTDRFASAAHLLHILGDSQDSVELDDWPPRTVGRTRIRARLRESFDRIQRGDPGTAFLLTGVNGQGKTRLLDLALVHARRLGLLVARGRCRRQDRPFGAFMGIYDELRPPEGNPVLDPVFNGEPVGERYPVIAAFRELVQARAPIVLAIDDLELADAATAELLTYLIRNTLELQSESIVFLMGHEAPEQHVLREVSALAPVNVEAMGPLEPSEVEELVVSVLGSGGAALALARRLHQESRGSPAFIADMLRGLLDDGLIEERQGRYAITVDAAEITRSRLPMPASLRQALVDRLQPLSHTALALGRSVAIARRRMDLDVLLECTDLSEDDAMEALDELVDAQIVEESRDGDTEYVELSHSRFHDVLLESSTPVDRARAHRRMGEVLERHHRGRLGPQVEDLAYHFTRAGTDTKAYAFLRMSIQRHVRQSLFGEALSLIQRALEVEPKARPYLLLDEADSQLAELYIQRSMALYDLGQSEESLESIRHAASIAAQVPNPGLEARVASQLGQRLRSKGDAAGAARELERARVKSLESGNQTLLPDILYHLGGLAWGDGDLTEATRLWAESLEIATRVGDGRAAAWANNGLGIGHTCAGESMQGRKHFEQAATQMERQGMVGPLSIVRCNLAELYLSTGILRKSLSQVDKAVAQSREMEHVSGVALGLAWRTTALTILGRLDEARRTVEEGLRFCRNHGEREDEITTICAAIELSFARREPDQALQLIDEGIPLLEAHDREGREPLFTAWHARALAMVGRGDEARAMLADKQPPTAPWQNTQVRIDLAWAEAYTLLDRPDDAIELFERALATAERIGYRMFQLLAHHHLSKLHADAAVASRHARVANGLARSLAANLPREDAKRFLSREWGTR